MCIRDRASLGAKVSIDTLDEPTDIAVDAGTQSLSLIHISSQAFIGLLYLPNGVLVYFASQAVWQRRVVSVSIPLRHGTTLVALTLLIGVPIFQLEQKLDIVKESFPLPAWIWPLLVAPVVLLLVNRLHETAVELVDRIFNRRFHSAKRQLKDCLLYTSRCV